MANMRDRIKMSREEVDAFLRERHTMSVATIGPDGRPHVIAMWYGFLEDGVPAFETYRKSQKVLNLRRDPRMTCLIEDGDRYENLRGVELIGTGTILEDKEPLRTIARSLFERYETGFGPDQGDEYINFMVAKRVAVRIDIDDIVSWDHGKIAG